LVEPAYLNQSREAKKQFWLNRFDENVVAWLWDFLGIIDLRKALGGAFGLYAKKEFAFVCEAMWQCVIALNVERAHQIQQGNVHTRGLSIARVTTIDRTNYRQHIGKFNSKYNIAHPAAPVQSLAVLQVIKTSIQAIRPHQLGVTPLHQRRRGQVRTR
jgi:hypothetical protein